MRTFTSKAGWVVAALLGVTLVAAWAGIINAGTLDPPGPIGPSMKSLDDVPGSWHRLLLATGGCDSERFDCVLLDQAVLDRETGLVWQKTPDLNTMGWETAFTQCRLSTHAGRMGWRLPTVSELETLIDTGGTNGLPTGHPFLTGADFNFWTSTADPLNDGRAFRVDIANFNVNSELVGSGYRAWCVRGAGGDDVQ